MARASSLDGMTFAEKSNVTWKGFRSTLLWMFFLASVGIVALLAGAYHWWMAKDALLAQVVHDKLSDVMPHAEVNFEGMRFVDSSHLELTNLTIHSSLTQSQLIRVPRIVIDFDGQVLQAYQRVVIREIMVQSPEVSLIRNADGKWNWDGFEIEQPEGSASPSWTIKNGVVLLGVQTGEPAPRIVTFQGLQASFQPVSYRRYEMTAQCVAESVGPIEMTGLLDAETGELQVDGHAREARLEDRVLDLASRFVPRVQTGLAQLRQSNHNFRSHRDEQSPIQTAGVGQMPLVEKQASATRLPEPRLMRADLSVGFQLRREQDGAPLDYVLTGLIENGQVSESLMPVPLYDLEGEVTVTPDRVLINQLRAGNGPSTLFVDGRADRLDGHWDMDFQVRAHQLTLDQRIRPFLPVGLARIYDMFTPEGTFDVDVHLARKGEKLDVELKELTASDCRATCDRFRYPIENISGHVTQTGRTFALQLAGTAAGQPVRLNGTVKPFEPLSPFSVHADIDKLPLDATFVAALEHPDFQMFQEAVKSLRLQGVAEGISLDVFRNVRTAGETKYRIDGHVRDATINFTGFPYEITQLRGHVTYDPLVSESWLFRDLEGHHRQATITGEGVYDLTEPPGKLSLQLTPTSVAVDHDLQQASRIANSELGILWDEFDLGGHVDVDRLLIGWHPGLPCQVLLNGIHWTDGTLLASALPLQWNQVAGKMDWDGERLTIHSLQGWHGETFAHIEGGSGAAASYVQVPTVGVLGWRMHLGDLSIVKLQPDDEVRRAMPESISLVLNTLDLKGPLDLKLGLDMKGWRHDADLITAEWTLETQHVNSALVAGLPLTQVAGRTRTQGRWDGQSLSLEGFVELETGRVMGLPLRDIHGPLLVKDNTLIVGTPKNAPPGLTYHEQNPYGQRQLQGNLYGGKLGLDALLDIGGDLQTAPYSLEMNISNVELAAWAEDQPRGTQAHRLKGKLNGNAQIDGLGPDPLAAIGQGWIQITNAELYELPVFAQTFALLNFKPIDETAFKYAYADFIIEKGVFDFAPIELYGDALGLHGRGTVGFAGPQQSSVNLNLYSKMMSRIPVVKQIVDLLGNNWVHVQVVGTVSQPRPIVETRLGPVDEATREFMQAFDAGQPRRAPPRPAAPRTVP